MLGLLCELERQRLGEAARRRAGLDGRLAEARAERAALAARRRAAGEAAAAAEALPHLGPFRRVVDARIARCDAEEEALRVELEAAEEELRARWRWSKALEAAARRPL